MPLESNRKLPYLSIRKVATLVNLHPFTILNLIKKGDFPEGYKVNNKGILRFDLKKIEMWVRERCL
jgi:predicted DNA-binding transcriptional regulator AlpA